jgi:propane monooxygenase reductase component
VALESTMYNVTILPAGRRFSCGEDETILEAALREGGLLPYGCREGGCGSCKARIVEGEIDNSEASPHALMDFERANGYGLLCSAYPLTDVAIWSEDWEEQALEGRPRTVEVRVSEISNITVNIVLIRAALASGATLAFRSGQYVELRIPGTDEWRAYSLANPPAQSDRLELLVRLVPGGMFSEYLLNGRVRSGDSIEVRGAFGNFWLREGMRPLVLIAGSSGLAPILSMLRDMAGKSQLTRPIRLLYGARKRQDLCFVEELHGYESRFADLRFIPVLSEAEDDPDWSGDRGLITEFIERWCEGSRTQAYLCGPPPMIDAALSVLDRVGVPKEQIFFDKFLTKADLAA